MANLFDRYRIEVVPKHTSLNSRKSKNRSLDQLRAAIGNNPVNSITSQFIYKYRDHIGTSRSEKQANLDLEVLSHCFTKAIEWGVVARHPMTNKQVVKFSLKGRDRYVEDWELQEWATVANPFLVVYAVLKGVIGLRQQDLLMLRNVDQSAQELVSKNLKTGKKLRFALYDSEGQRTIVKLALDSIDKYYATRKRKVQSEWLFHTRTGTCYYNLEKSTASGFQSIWQGSMKKALALTTLEERFTEHDLRAKVGSDEDSDVAAQKLLAHANAATTAKHYRRKGAIIQPGRGFTLKE
jgi:integrase